MVTTQQLVVFSVFAVVILAFRSVSAGRKAGKLPPGPKGKPIIGNLFDLPPTGQQEWIHWLKHKEQYGISPFPSLGK
jgi:hypothetical protein